MKHTHLLTIALLGLSVCGLPLQQAQADDTATTTLSPRKEKKKKKKPTSADDKEASAQTDAADQDTSSEENAEEERPTVASALKQVKFLTSTKPSSKAKYYVFLHSASWCGPCRAIMPDIVKEYKKMKRKKVELILACGDTSEESAENYIKSYKMKFPAAMPGALVKVPGYKNAAYYPNAIIVDQYGQVVQEGHGKILLEWNSIITEANNKAAAEN